MRQRMMLLVCGITVVACSGQGLDTGTADPSAPGEAATPLVTGTVVAIDVDGRATPAQGVQACAWWNGAAAGCETTAEDGAFITAYDTQSSVVLQAQKPGFLSARTELVVGSRDVATQILLLSTTAATAYATAAHRVHVPDTSTGVLVNVTVLNPGGLEPFAAASVEITDSQGTAIPVVYADPDGRPDASLESTSTRGFAAALGLAATALQIRVEAPDPATRCGVWKHQSDGVKPESTLVLTAGVVQVVDVACVPNFPGR